MRSRSTFWLAAITLLGPMVLFAAPLGGLLGATGMLCGTGSASAAEPVESPKPLNVIARQRADEKRILAALEKRISVAIKEMPVCDVADYVKESIGVTVALDRRALEQATIPPDVPVTIAMKDVPARTILNCALADLELTWIVRDGLLWITTPDRAKSIESLTVRVHDVADLVQSAAGDSPDFDSLINVVTSTVAPHTWDTVGGNGSIAPHGAVGICALVVSQSFEVHEQVESLFAELRKLQKRSAKTEPPAKELPNASSPDPGEPPVTPEQTRILAALERRISLDLQEAPLDKAMWFFRNELKERVLISVDSLGGKPDKPITLHLKNVTIREALDAFVKSLNEDDDVAWQIGPHAIRIDEKSSYRFMQVKVYDVSDLVDGGESPEQFQERCGELAGLITATIAPTRWDVVGGDGSITTYPYGKRVALIVSQTWSVHRDVAALLAELRKQRHGKAPATAPIVVQPESRPPVGPVEKALAGTISVEFNKASLLQAAEILSKKIGVPVVVDRHAVESAGARPELPCQTFRAADWPVPSVLDRLLGELDESLCWLILDETILISTMDELWSQDRLATKVYDVRDLVMRRDKSGKKFADFDTLISTITSTVYPNSWATVGGNGAIQPFEGNGVAAISVGQNQFAHERLERLLADLRQVLRPHAADPPLAGPPKPKPEADPSGGVDPPLAADPKRDAAVAAVNRFSFDLYRQAVQGRKNAIFSPVGISLALGAIRAGARGQTATEMNGAVRLAMPTDEIEASYAALLDSLVGEKKPKGCVLDIATRLWLQQGYPIHDPYRQLIEKSFDTSIAPADFLKPASAAGQINAWVRQKTRDRIQQAIDPRAIDPEETRMIFVNSVYFKGKWSQPFNIAKTKPEPFRSPEKEIRVSMMHQETGFQYAEAEGLQILEASYAGEGTSMVVLLPADQPGAFENLERSLSAEKLQEWTGTLNSRIVKVYLPRFDFHLRYGLQPWLLNLGMKRAWDRKLADFAGITSEKEFRIDSGTHEALIEVNEEGTVAAAVTAFGMGGGGMAPPKPPPIPVFRADRPFVFLIRDNRSGCILFMGRVVDPPSAAP